MKGIVSLEEIEQHMDLQTIVKIDKPDFQIGYDSRIMMLGSCFVENIGQKLEYFKFNVDINPCGIVYNPLSVAETLKCLMECRPFTESDLLPNDGKWVSLAHHGRFSDVQPAVCLRKINGRLEHSAAFLKDVHVLVITWGTSWVYRHLETGRIVANCHKFPASAFGRFQLDVPAIVSAYTGLFRELLGLYPDLKVLFTVSPIRHWKDGAHGNQLSKAVLLLAIDELMRMFDGVSYFPSYEIVMDELRDYRFYAEDMLHISPQGIEYIWERFREEYMTGEAKDGMRRIGQVNKTLLHRPVDPDNEQSRKLRQQMEDEMEQIKRDLGLNQQMHDL